MESHPECWHRGTPRSTHSAHRVSPQMLMHTSRCRHHNRITQDIIWLADCPPEVTGLHSFSAIHNSTEQRCIVSRLFCSDRDVSRHLFCRREGVTGNTIHTGVLAKRDCVGDYVVRNTQQLMWCLAASTIVVTDVAHLTLKGICYAHFKLCIFIPGLH